MTNSPSNPTCPLCIHINLAPEGLHPGLMAITPDNRFLVIPCQDSNNVIFLSIENLTITKVIPLGDGSCPWMAQITPDGAFALITLARFSTDGSAISTDNSSVAVIDLNNQSLVREVQVGVGPNGIAIEDDGSRAFVANSRSNNISVIDLLTWQVTHTIQVGKGPFNVVIDLLHDLLVVVNFEDASLSLVDLSSLQVTATISVGNSSLSEPNPEWGLGDTTWFTVGPTGLGYVTNWRSNQIVIVDLENQVVLNQLESPLRHPFEIRYRGEGSHLSVAGDIEGRVTMFEPETGNVLEELDTRRSLPPTGPATEYNSWLNDPNNNSMVLFAPQGLNNLSAMINIPMKHL
ncbi:hypothetical protein IQ268_12130 [Oculatella sp. LEGE 06141]|uniref:YncE family protein n=1 Tax=Oculatella sp. LEGE 06141 TaxID=1828648 RepID=UPI00187F619B|nr:hypothetical protein [Oculatella sp. LEGE 06141]MBE9179309.1 hypothetical protein [Oculatella sp. LEGE 06141]